MDEKLILNDGTEIKGYFIISDSRLFVYMTDISLADAFALMNDPEKTKVIKEDRYGEKTTARGFKHLYTITEESDNMVSAALKKI